MADPTIPPENQQRSEAEVEASKAAALQQTAAGGLDDIPNMEVFARKRPKEDPRHPSNRGPVGAMEPGSNRPVSDKEYNDYIKVQDYANAYYSMTPGEKQTLLANIEKLGGDTTKMKDQDIFKVWQEYVVQAAMYTNKGMDFNPWDVMGMDISTQEERKKAELQKGPVTATSTSTDVSTDTKFSTKLDAKAMLYQASRTLLGRAPTETEVNNFFTSLNSEEAANPETTTTTNNRTVTTTEGIDGGPGPTQSESSSSNRVTSGGLSADAKQMLTLDAAKKNPEYGAYQAATTFKDALMAKVYGKGY